MRMPSSLRASAGVPPAASSAATIPARLCCRWNRTGDASRMMRSTVSERESSTSVTGWSHATPGNEARISATGSRSTAPVPFLHSRAAIQSARDLRRLNLPDEVFVRKRGGTKATSTWSSPVASLSSAAISAASVRSKKSGASISTVGISVPSRSSRTASVAARPRTSGRSSLSRRSTSERMNFLPAWISRSCLRPETWSSPSMTSPRSPVG